MQFEDKGIIGADVSFYQADPRKKQFINFQKMKDEGVSFVIMKASQELYADPAFAVNRAAARAVGLPRAFYHFLDYDKDGKAQARFYWNLIKDDPGEGPLIVDFEAGSGTWQRLYDFIVELQKISGYSAERIWIYTGYFYWMDFGPDTPAELQWFIPYRLWLAAYPDLDSEIPMEKQIANIKVPRPWLTSTMWQKGTTIVYGPDWGVLSREIDYNIFNGGRELFNRYFLTDYVPGEPEVPQEEPTEEPGGQMKYKVIWSGGAAKRTAPHTSNTSVGTLLNQQEVEVIQDNIPDANDPNNPNKVWVKLKETLPDGQPIFVASNYPTSAGVPSLRMVKIVEPVPPTDPLRDPFVLKIYGYKEYHGELERE